MVYRLIDATFIENLLMIPPYFKIKIKKVHKFVELTHKEIIWNNHLFAYIIDHE